MLINKAYKALAHPIRRDILKRLRAGPLHAGAFAPLYDISKPSLSSHFTILKEAGLIDPDRDGNHIYYRLNATVADEVMAGVMELLGTEETPQARRAKEETEKVSRKNKKPRDGAKYV